MNGSCPSLELDVVAQAVAPASVGVSVNGCPFDASDAKAWELESCQFVLGEGPSSDASGGVRTARVPDVVATELWPELNEYLVARSIDAVFSVPLKVNSNHPFGSLTVYRYEVGDLSEEQRRSVEVAATQVAATVAAHVVSDAVPHGVGCGVCRIDQLNRAIGIVIADLGVGPGEASARIRSYSYASDRALDDVITGLLSQRIRLAPN